MPERELFTLALANSCVDWGVGRTVHSRKDVELCPGEAGLCAAGWHSLQGLVGGAVSPWGFVEGDSSD